MRIKQEVLHRAEYCKPPLADISVLYGKHHGKIGVVVGSGPSSLEIDHSILSHEDIVSVDINSELKKNKDKYIPDYWMMNDHQAMDSALVDLSEYSLKETTKVIVGESIWIDCHFGEFCREFNLKEIYSYMSSDPRDGWSENHLPISKTTAIPALFFLLMSGVSGVILIGVDCYSNSESITIDRNQAAMIKDFAMSRRMIRDNGFSDRIYQTSERSPMSCFEKLDLEEALIELGVSS